ncbi:MAG: hypothetical protein AAFO95_03515, partial [Cyanobacteria bacterium J06600_6]
PLILAFATTVLIVSLGFSWLAKSRLGDFGLLAEGSKENTTVRKVDNSLSDVPAKVTAKVKSNLKGTPASADSSQRKFVLPVIVPQGTSVAINGSKKLSEVNQILRKNFHQQYPGTVITTNGDGSAISLELLYSREIDLAALDRPLSKAEKEAGLTEIAIYNSEFSGQDPQGKASEPSMYYVYQEPLSPDTEAFLGYVFSKKGQQAISQF